jgi:hypothetical protein
LVVEDAELQNLSKEKQQEFIDRLAEFRTTKHTGAHVSNNAAATDTRGTMNRINVEVSSSFTTVPYF